MAEDEKKSSLFTNMESKGEAPEAQPEADKATEEKAEPKVETKAQDSEAGNKILLVEDEKPLSRVLSLKLGKVGFDVATAYNGADALKTLEEGNFDLVLLDLVMPKMGGFEVLEEMQSRGIKVRTIILSNLSQNEDKQKAMKLGAVDFFTKSDTPIVSIVENIKKILE